MRYITVAVLGVALLLPNISQACHRSGGCHGGGSCHGGWGGGCHGGGRCHGGWGGCHGGHGGGCHGGYYGGCQGGGCHGGYASGGWGGGGYAYYNGGVYSAPYQTTMGSSTVPYGGGYYSDNMNGAIRSSSYYDSNIGVIGGGRQARVEVIVPDANTEVMIQGQRMSSTGPRRFFISPELESGKTYSYSISIPGGEKGKEETRTVEVQAGKSVTVDFSRSDNVNRQDNRIPAPSTNPPPSNPQGRTDNIPPPK